VDVYVNGLVLLYTKPSSLLYVQHSLVLAVQYVAYVRRVLLYVYSCVLNVYSPTCTYVDMEVELGRGHGHY
jgi:hypothetical protein